MCGDVAKEEFIREDDEEQVEGRGDNIGESRPVDDNKGSCEAMSEEEEASENAMADIDDSGTIFVKDRSKIGWGDKAWPVFLRDVDPLSRCSSLLCRKELVFF